jgi:outer membrane protein TolC
MMKGSKLKAQGSSRVALLAIFSLSCFRGFAAEPERIDLVTVLRLAGAQNLDVQLATEKLKEARANEAATLWQFFPWIAPGIGYKAHNGKIQDVQGNILDVDKQALSVGPTVVAQLDLGETIYKRLASKQLTLAATHGAEAQRQQSQLVAAEAYFDLAKAHANVRVAGEAVNISAEYKDQITNGVQAGVAFKGDELRAQTQMHRNELLLKQAEEQRRVAAAKLAQVLHLDAAVSLLPREDDAVPMKLTSDEVKLDQLLAKALSHRPELKQGDALAAAASTGVRGAKFGPLVPTLGAQVFGGGLGNSSSFGSSGDYQVTLGWRIGTGGLFDSSRIHQAESKAAQAAIFQAKTRDEVARQVVENHERVKLLRSELEVTKQEVQASQEGLKLARERKEFAVGIVLETVQSEQDLTKARLDYVNTVMELNKAQYRLKAAIGE